MPKVLYKGLKLASIGLVLMTVGLLLCNLLLGANLSWALVFAPIWLPVAIFALGVIVFGGWTAYEIYKDFNHK